MSWKDDGANKGLILMRIAFLESKTVFGFPSSLESVKVHYNTYECFSKSY